MPHVVVAVGLMADMAEPVDLRAMSSLIKSAARRRRPHHISMALRQHLKDLAVLQERKAHVLVEPVAVLSGFRLSTIYA